MSNASGIRTISRAYHAELDKFAAEKGKEPSAYYRASIRASVLQAHANRFPAEVAAIQAYLKAFSERMMTVKKGASGKGKTTSRTLTELEKKGKRLMDVMNNDSRERTMRLDGQATVAEWGGGDVAEASPSSATTILSEAANSTSESTPEEPASNVRPNAEGIYERLIKTLHCAPPDIVVAQLLQVPISEPARWRFALRHKYDFNPLVIKGQPTATNTMWCASPINVEDRRANLIKTIDKKMQNISLDDLVSLADLLEKR